MTDPDADRCHLLPGYGTGQPAHYHATRRLNPDEEGALQRLIDAARRQFARDDTDGDLTARQAASRQRIRERNQRLLGDQPG